MEKPEYKIKIELELNPAIAMLLATSLLEHINGTNLMGITDNGKKYLFDIGQNIVDQVAEKTDFNKLKS